MLSPAGKRPRSSHAAVVSDEPKRPTQESIARKRDIKQLEVLRKLRRDRAELVLRDARTAFARATHEVTIQRAEVGRLTIQYADSQATVEQAIAARSYSLQELNPLLARIDRARDEVQAARSHVVSLTNGRDVAEQQAIEASELSRLAAAAHEKILEWKKLP